jgi:hypothetical protein
MRSRIHFFAVQEDWESVFAYVERKHPVTYTATGFNQMRNPDPPRFLAGSTLPNLGLADCEQCIACYSYMVTPFPAVPAPSRSIMSDGVARYDLNTGTHLDSVRLIHAGRWKDMIIAGLIDTMGQGSKAQALMRAFHTSMSKSFTRVNAYWVGPQANAEWLLGRRLTYAEQSPPEYDLRKLD